MTNFPDPIFVQAGETRLATYQLGGDTANNEGRPPIILVHGWPELAYSWKNQMAPLAAAGFRVIAVDLKGFGGSDCPKDPNLYGIRHLTDELVALLDALHIDQAIFCGHDWGGAIVWPMAQLHPDRVAGVIGVCTPHRPPPPIPPLTIFEKRFSKDHYIVRFQEPEAPEKIFAGGEERFFQLMFRRPATKADMEKLGVRIYDLIGRFENGPAPDVNGVILSPEDLAVYVNAYKRSGFTGGVNLYRNIDQNHEVYKTLNPVIDKPALFVAAAQDFFLPPDGADGMEELVPRVEKHLIEDCGHWVTWEKPDELNAIMVGWLGRVFS